jgi:hypothetical protein
MTAQRSPTRAQRPSNDGSPLIDGRWDRVAKKDEKAPSAQEDIDMVLERSHEQYCTLHTKMN